MEACRSDDYWVRVFQRLGHTVKLIARQFQGQLLVCVGRSLDMAAAFSRKVKKEP
jgi:hypothetical protein